MPQAGSSRVAGGYTFLFSIKQLPVKKCTYSKVEPLSVAIRVKIRLQLQLVFIVAPARPGPPTRQASQPNNRAPPIQGGVVDATPGAGVR